MSRFDKVFKRFEGVFKEMNGAFEEMGKAFDEELDDKTLEEGVTEHETIVEETKPDGTKKVTKTIIRRSK